MSTGRHRRTGAELVRDFALYVLIGIVLAAGIILWVFYVPVRYWPRQEWVGLVGSTLVLEILFVRVTDKSIRRRALFWLAGITVVALRTTAWVLVLERAPSFKAPWFALTLPLELA